MSQANFPVKATIERIASTAMGLEVVFHGTDKARVFTWFWLRDHGVDAESLDVKTLQRKVNTFSIPDDLSPADVAFDQGSGTIDIRWRSGQTTTITSDLLAEAENLLPQSHVLAPGAARYYWSNEHPLTEIPTVQFSEVMASNRALLEWLECIEVYGFCLIDSVPTSDSDTEALVNRIGEVQRTLFGGMWHLSAELEDHGDSAYSTQYLEPHTDGTYYHDAPGLQLFNCQEFNGQGGESILVDGFAIAGIMRSQYPDEFETLCQISVPGHYQEPGVHVRAERPVVLMNNDGSFRQVSFNNYDRAPMRLSKEDEHRFYSAYRRFHALANEQSHWKKIPLRPGKALIFDNWRMLHGRMGYVGKRVFYGGYLSRATYESALRVAQSQEKRADQ